jgi:hypothetical protein
MRLIWVPSCETPSPNQQRKKSGLVSNGPASRRRRRAGSEDSVDGFDDSEGSCGMANTLSLGRGVLHLRIASRYSHRATIGE